MIVVCRNLKPITRSNERLWAVLLQKIVMKTFRIRQYTKMALPLGLLYLAVVFLLAYYTLGGIDGMADRVNAMGSAKGAGFVVAIIVFVPLFILLRFIHPAVTLSLDKGKMIIGQKGKKETVILLQAIARMEWNRAGLNRADFYDRENRLLASLRDTRGPDVLLQVLEEITGSLPFERITGNRKFVNRPLETIVFKRK